MDAAAGRVRARARHRTRCVCLWTSLLLGTDSDGWDFRTGSLEPDCVIAMPTISPVVIVTHNIEECWRISSCPRSPIRRPALFDTDMPPRP